MTDRLRAYFEADLAYLADYAAKERAVAACLDDPEDRAQLLHFASAGVAQELAMMASYGMDVPVALPHKTYELKAPWQVELASILPCFTVYAENPPFPFYGEPLFQAQTETMRRMVAKYRARYPELAAAMDDAIARDTQAQHAFLAAHLAE